MCSPVSVLERSAAMRAESLIEGEQKSLPRRRTCQGFSLIETLITIVILGVALTAISRALFDTVGHSSDPIWYSKASQVAQSYLDDALGLRYQEESPVGGGSLGSCTVAGPEGDEPGRVDFDDIDDYHGLTQTAEWLDEDAVSAADQFQVSLSVFCQAPDGSAASNSKRVQITVTGPGELSVVMSAFRGDF
ncbi:MAG: type IV pilus modification PilV family protein [Oceanobacter sp.]